MGDTEKEIRNCIFITSREISSYKVLARIALSIAL